MSVLSDHVLVLNRYFLAGQVSTVMSVIKVLVKGHARVIDENLVQYDLKAWDKRSRELIGTEGEKLYAGVVRSPSTTILAPQVIYLPFCETSSRELEVVKYSRRNVFVRDNYTCQYCGHKGGKGSLSLDHVIPKSRGGPSSFTNIVTACKPCNAKKENKLLEEIGFKLLKKPTEPKWRSHVVGTPFNKVRREYWNRFL